MEPVTQFANGSVGEPNAVPKVATGDQTQDQQWMPHWMGGLRDQLSRIGRAARHASIVALPEVVVNNSSNIGGVSHVLTEFVMFKSGMKDAKLIDNPGNPINWVVEPFNNIRKDIWKNAKGGGDFEGLWKGNPIKNFAKFTTNTVRATELEVARQRAAGATKISLGNPWQSRTTLCGLTAWGLSAMIPEQKESDEQIEKMATMRTLHPLHYVGTRLMQGLWLPEWNQHKREMIGIGYLGIGTCSMIGSWRNRRKLVEGVAKDAEFLAKGLKQVYMWNWKYFATGAVSFASALPLLFALDEKKAYEVYGLCTVPRLPFLVGSLKTKFDNKEDGWQYYSAGKIAFLLEDTMQALIGGAEKHTDANGHVTIIDHTMIEKEAIEKAKEYKYEQRELRNDADLQVGGTRRAPMTSIVLPSRPERAMPERQAAMVAHIGGVA